SFVGPRVRAFVRRGESGGAARRGHAVRSARSALMNAAAQDASFSQFLEAWDLFRDPVITGMLAGLLLGFLGVYIVLRRMVFVSAAISQSAALGVSLTFLAEMYEIVPKQYAEPMVGALIFALVAMGFFTLNPEKLRLTREGL